MRPAQWHYQPRLAQGDHDGHKPAIERAAGVRAPRPS